MICPVNSEDPSIGLGRLDNGESMTGKHLENDALTSAGPRFGPADMPPGPRSNRTEH